MTKQEAMAKALDLCLIAGNHLGTHKQPYWPHSETPWAEAMAKLAKYGQKETDMWNAWSLIMRASHLIRGAKIVPFQSHASPADTQRPTTPSGDGA